MDEFGLKFMDKCELRERDESTFMALFGNYEKRIFQRRKGTEYCFVVHDSSSRGCHTKLGKNQIEGFGTIGAPKWRQVVLDSDSCKFWTTLMPRQGARLSNFEKILLSKLNCCIKTTWHKKKCEQMFVGT